MSGISRRNSAEVLASASSNRWVAGEPVYLQIAAWIRRAARDSVLQPGQPLPPERALADALRVSRMTLRQAFEVLQATGELGRAGGSRGGLAVTAPQSSINIADLVGLRSQLLRSARTATSRIASARTAPADAVTAGALEIDEGAPVHEIVRVRFADEVAVVLERSAFPAERLPGMLEHDITGSLYTLLRDRYGKAPDYATQELEPVLIDAVDAALLGVDEALPALRVVRTSSTARNERIEHSRDIFRSDQLRITVEGRILTLPPAGP